MIQVKKLYDGTKEELIEKYGNWSYYFDDGTRTSIEEQLAQMELGFGVVFYRQYDKIEALHLYIR